MHILNDMGTFNRRLPDEGPIPGVYSLQVSLSVLSSHLLNSEK